MRLITSNVAGASSRRSWRVFSPCRLFLRFIAETRIRVFELEESPFSFQAAGEAAQAPVFPHHPVAGNDDRHRISAGAGPGGADGQGGARPLGPGARAGASSLGGG